MFSFLTNIAAVFLPATFSVGAVFLTAATLTAMIPVLSLVGRAITTVCTKSAVGEQKLHILDKIHPSSACAIKNSIGNIVLYGCQSALFIHGIRYLSPWAVQLDAWSGSWTVANMLWAAVRFPVEIICMVLIYDAFLYITHRTMHKFKVRLHFVHHEIVHPTGIVATLYGDYLESLLLGGYAWIPIYMLRPWIWSVAFYLTYITIMVYINHSGKAFRIPYIYDSEFHYRHHTNLNCNFGEYTKFWDILFKTNYKNIE